MGVRQLLTYLGDESFVIDVFTFAHMVVGHMVALRRACAPLAVFR